MEQINCQHKQSSHKNKYRKVVNPYTIRDLYKFFNEDPLKGTLIRVPYLVYRDVIESYFKWVSEQVLQSHVVQLPWGCGTMYIEKYKLKTKNTRWMTIDYVTSKELKKRVYHLNDHTDGWRYRWKWIKGDRNYTNKTKYQFIPTRTNKRELARIIKSKETDYRAK